MFIIRIVLHIMILYVFYFIGLYIQKTFNLFIPGSVIGMLLLLALFALKIIKPTWIEQGTSFLLRHMAILFLPVTVGIINFFPTFTGKGILLIVIVLVSTLVVMVSSGLTSQLLVLRKERMNE